MKTLHRRHILNEDGPFLMKFRTRMSRRETAQKTKNMPFRTGKICATVWVSRAARQRAIVFGSFLFESGMILGYWLTVCDLLQPEYIIRRYFCVFEQIFFSRTQDTRVAALLHFHV